MVEGLEATVKRIDLYYITKKSKKANNSLRILNEKMWIGFVYSSNTNK